MQELELGSNKISVLPEGVFTGLSNLQTLYLSSNPKLSCVPPKPPTVQIYSGPLEICKNGVGLAVGVGVGVVGGLLVLAGIGVFIMQRRRGNAQRRPKTRSGGGNDEAKCEAEAEQEIPKLQSTPSYGANDLSTADILVINKDGIKAVNEIALAEVVQEAPHGPEWNRCVDPASGEPYFHNEETGKTTW